MLSPGSNAHFSITIHDLRNRERKLERKYGRGTRRCFSTGSGVPVALLAENQKARYHLERLNQGLSNPAQQFCAILGIQFLQADTDVILNCDNSTSVLFPPQRPGLLKLTESWT